MRGKQEKRKNLSDECRRRSDALSRQKPTRIHDNMGCGVVGVEPTAGKHVGKLL